LGVRIIDGNNNILKSVHRDEDEKKTKCPIWLGGVVDLLVQGILTVPSASLQPGGIIS
jgi:hypothetical protein